MKYYLLPAIIVVIHLTSWGKLLYQSPQLWAGIFFISCVSYFVFNWKEVKRLPFVLHALPLKKTGYLLFVQCLFLLIILFANQLHIQFIAILGVILCEIVRLKQYPVQVMEKDYLAQLSNKMNEMDMHFLTIRAQRHDFLKHVSAIGYFIEQERNQDARQYFEDLLGEYKETNDTIKGEKIHISSILWKYKRIAEQTGTIVNYHLHVPVSRMPINRLNQVQLITNLLENAVDATRSFHTRFAHSAISLHTEVHGGIYIVEIKNNAFFDDRTILDTLFDQFENSSKNGDHQGIGTFIISSLVKSHNGKLSYRYQNQELVIKIKLPLILNQKNKHIINNPTSS
ncbi:sensor histidine kinase [Shimazuella kribbensis]|uniref:sensor histidine kinase n=1 Tax=Shimazuella kribbensis TaxID=139808 RepID=UPI0003F4F348|nr:GHKL domain-containing protein [Shimazuella kribbensis]